MQVSLFSDSDRYYMQRAIELAKQGWFHTSPNPRVGSVIVANGNIIGEGFHPKAGLPHAERFALQQVQDNGLTAEGATCYVTLEPCSHTGRTGPCADALVAAKVAKVVIAMQDPNPQVAGKGIQKLQDAGIEVQIGLLEAQAKALNPGFIQRMVQQKPLVRLKMATSLDGKSAMQNGDSVWITGDAAREQVQKLRAQSCVLITGVDSVNIDNPAMNVRLPACADANGEIRQPTRLIIDSKLRIDLTSRLFDIDGDIVLVYGQDSHEHKPEVVAQLVAKGVKLMPLPLLDGHIDLTVLLLELGKSYNEVLVEAGAQLSSVFLAANLVDQLIVYQAPVLLGATARSMVNFDLQTMADVQRLPAAQVQQVGQDIRLLFNFTFKGLACLPD